MHVYLIGPYANYIRQQHPKGINPSVDDSYLYETGFACNLYKSGQTHTVKSNILVIPKIDTQGNQNSYFLSNIICRYLTYLYYSKYFLFAFFNHWNYTNLGHNPGQRHRTEAVGKKRIRKYPQKKCVMNSLYVYIAKNNSFHKTISQ